MEWPKDDPSPSDRGTSPDWLRFQNILERRGPSLLLLGPVADVSASKDRQCLPTTSDSSTSDLTSMSVTSLRTHQFPPLLTLRQMDPQGTLPTCSVVRHGIPTGKPDNEFPSECTVPYLMPSFGTFSDTEYMYFINRMSSNEPHKIFNSSSVALTTNSVLLAAECRNRSGAWGDRELSPTILGSKTPVGSMSVLTTDASIKGPQSVPLDAWAKIREDQENNKALLLISPAGSPKTDDYGVIAMLRPVATLVLRPLVYHLLRETRHKQKWGRLSFASTSNTDLPLPLPPEDIKSRYLVLPKTCIGHLVQKTSGPHQKVLEIRSYRKCPQAGVAHAKRFWTG
ncbi:hypothetical protein E5288_WYG018558 [Bos mutus]|uniref:Uncharacterized protein n=1 Tax=Bos mutus TaxID=72004 RepID=A0A6B0RYJ3_9CETA|nr:hypothetical protein [Bos mutus]